MPPSIVACKQFNQSIQNFLLHLVCTTHPRKNPRRVPGKHGSACIPRNLTPSSLAVQSIPVLARPKPFSSFLATYNQVFLGLFLWPLYLASFLGLAPSISINIISSHSFLSSSKPPQPVSLKNNLFIGNFRMIDWTISDDWLIDITTTEHSLSEVCCLCRLRPHPELAHVSQSTT